VFGFALAATQIRPSLAMPLFLGGVFAWALDIRALYRHWDLLDRLADERDAFVIPEVASYASRHATSERRLYPFTQRWEAEADAATLNKQRQEQGDAQAHGYLN
jgi:hypothetical protein